MSNEVVCTTEIRNKLLLKNTLEEMGIVYQELKNEQISFGTGYDKMVIDCQTGKVRYDEMMETQLNQLKQTYGKNLVLAEIVKKGHRIDSVKVVNNVIEVIAGY